MPNELDEIRELYESNKKKMDIIRGLSKKSVAKLPKETQEELIKQTKKFGDAEASLLKQGIIRSNETKSNPNKDYWKANKDKLKKKIIGEKLLGAALAGLGPTAYAARRITGNLRLEDLPDLDVEEAKAMGKFKMNYDDID